MTNQTKDYFLFQLICLNPKNISTKEDTNIQNIMK